MEGPRRGQEKRRSSASYRSLSCRARQVGELHRVRGALNPSLPKPFANQSRRRRLPTMERLALPALLPLLLSLGAASSSSLPPAVQVDVDGAAPGLAISKHLWGVFYEDLEASVDGGMYAELVKNRDVAVPGPPDEMEKEEGPGGGGKGKKVPPGWAAHGAAEVERSSEAPLNKKNSHCLQVTATAANGGARNTGYWGMAVRAGETYHLSLYARSAAAVTLHVALLAAGTEIGSTDIDTAGHSSSLDGSAAGWAKFERTLTTTATASDAQLLVTAHAICRNLF